MQPAEFLTALADFNAADQDSLQDFLWETQSPSNSPEPIPIGTHEGVRYFIDVSDDTVQYVPGSDKIPPAEFDDCSVWDGRL